MQPLVAFAALLSILAPAASVRAEGDAVPLDARTTTLYKRVIALNAALMLVVAERTSDLAGGLELARTSLSSGAALAVFERLRQSNHVEFA